MDGAHATEEALDRAEALQLLGSVPVGRVVFTDGGLPVVVPVAFLLVGSAVVFLAATGSRLAAGTDGAVVAFEADEVEPSRHAGWSVTVTGRASSGAVPAGLHEHLVPGAPAEHGRLVSIPLTVVTGRRLRARSAAAPRPERGSGPERDRSRPR